MTLRQIDVAIAEKVFKAKVWGPEHTDPRLDYRADADLCNDEVFLNNDQITLYPLKRFTRDLDAAMLAFDVLNEGENDCQLTIKREINEGFSGYHAYVSHNQEFTGNGTGMTAAEALCKALLDIVEFVENPPPKPVYRSKDLYFKKDGEEGYYGLHEVGEEYPTDEAGSMGYMRMEAWINMYDDNHKFLGSVSRVFGPIEESVPEFLADGYKAITVPKKED